MKNIRTTLSFYYYGSMVFVVMAAVFAAYLLLKQEIGIDPNSDLGLKISYFVIIYVMASVPLCLALFNRYINKLKQEENKEIQTKKYLKAAKFRIVFIGLGMALGVFFFYILQQQSMIFAAGIAAVALYFCKPTLGKIENDLAPKIESDIDEI